MRTRACRGVAPVSGRVAATKSEDLRVRRMGNIG